MRGSHRKLKASPYFPASLFAISSTIFGRRSAITLSTILAIAPASDEAEEDDAVVPCGGADGAEPSAAAAAMLIAIAAISPRISSAAGSDTCSPFDFSAFDFESLRMDSSASACALESRFSVTATAD